MTLHELQSLLGFLNFDCKVVTPGRCFLRRLTNLIIGYTRPHHHIRLTAEGRKDLDAWLIFIQSFNGASLLLPRCWLQSNKLHLFTDAVASVDYAAVLGHRWFYGLWPEAAKSLHISILELYPIVMALNLWGEDLSNSCILFHCDNEAVVHTVNNQSTKNIGLMALIQKLVISCMSFNIVFRAQHIPGCQNITADLLSHSQVKEAHQASPLLNQQPDTIPEDLLPGRILLQNF